MSATQTVPVVVPVAPVVAVALVVPVAPVALVALVAPIAPGHRPSRGPTNAHKNLDFVLECLSLKKVDSLNTSYYVYLSNDTKR